MISQFIVSLTLKRINRKFGTDLHKKLVSQLLSAKYKYEIYTTWHFK